MQKVIHYFQSLHTPPYNWITVNVGVKHQSISRYIYLTWESKKYHVKFSPATKNKNDDTLLGSVPIVGMSGYIPRSIKEKEQRLVGSESE